MFYWAADYPAPSNFLAHLLSCAAFQPASVSQLNWRSSATRGSTLACARRPAHRRRTPARQPPLGRSRPGARRRRAWLPLYNPRAVELLSQRVGGRRYNPLYGTLIDQLWVR